MPHNRNDFENYLINNIKLETASSSRHGFGELYEENGALPLAQGILKPADAKYLCSCKFITRHALSTNLQLVHTLPQSQFL
ncbi:MAG: HpaII family restriction endonuclease [Bacteroidota bacterium]